MSLTKKVAIGIGGAVLLGVFLFGTRFFGYVGTVVDNARKSAQESVPFEYDLAELEKLVKAFDKDIETLNKQIVRLEVDIENTDEQIVAKESQIKEQESDMLAMINQLGDGTTEFVSIGKKEYPVAEVRADLVRREKEYDAAVSELKQKKSTRDSLAKNLSKLNEQKSLIRAEKAQYEADIAELAATKSALDAQKAADTVNELDDTRLNKARELKQKLQDRLRIDQKMLEKKQETSSGHIPINVEPEEQGDVRERLLEKLKNSNVKPADHELISIEKT